MDINLLDRKFRRMGARVKVGPPTGVMARNRQRVTIDIRRDAEGEYFEIRVPERGGPHVDAVDVQPRQRHLLLLVRDAQGPGGDDKQKFLCGHDERAWFVAAVPETAGASNVPTALAALKPPGVREAEARERVPAGRRNRRKNAAFVRQGEWFFIPAPALSVRGQEVRRNEPLSRGAGSKPHMCQYACRIGGRAGVA